MLKLGSYIMTSCIVKIVALKIMGSSIMKTKIKTEDWVYLYSELASYVENKLIGDSTRKTHDKDGNRLPEFEDQFCEIVDNVEEIMCNVLEKAQL